MSGLTLGGSLSSLPASHTGSCLSVRVDSPAQGGPQGPPGPPEGKAGDSGGDGTKAKASGGDPAAEEKQPAQGHVPLRESPPTTQM